MNPSQFPGQTEQPVPPSALLGGDDEFSLLEKCVQLLFLIVQSGGGGGGGSTIPSTTNLIKGDGAGNGADSGIAATSVIQGAAGSTASAIMTATGSGNTVQPSVAQITGAGLVFSVDNTYNIGASGSGRPAQIFASNQINAQTGFTLGNGGVGIKFANDARITSDSTGVHFTDADIHGPIAITVGGLSVISTTTGMLPPRMSTTQKNAIATPTAGMMVYDNTLNKLSVYTGAAWETVTSI